MGRKIVSPSLDALGAARTEGTQSRPATIDDVSSQGHIVSVLQKTLTSTNV